MGWCGCMGVAASSAMSPGVSRVMIKASYYDDSRSMQPLLIMQTWTCIYLIKMTDILPFILKMTPRIMMEVIINDAMILELDYAITQGHNNQT